MNFCLLLPQLPQIQQSRSHYEAMLALHVRKPRKIAVLWQRVKALLS